MEEKKVLQTEQLSELCKSLSASKEALSTTFSRLKQTHNSDELANIYNDLLFAQENSSFFYELIKEIDKLKNPINLDGLIDFILQQKTTGEIPPNTIETRVLAIKAISNFKDKKSITPILYCLNNKNEHYKTRLAAAEALGKIGDKNAVDSLIEVVSDENEKSLYVRESAAFALGMIGDMRALDPFLSILEAKKSFLDKFTFLKERVIEALGKIDFSSNNRIIAVFKNALEDESPQVRLNAVESLMNSSCREAVDLIKTMLDDTNEEVARSSVVALYNMEGRKALDEILDNPKTPMHCREEAVGIMEEYEE